MREPTDEETRLRDRIRLEVATAEQRMGRMAKETQMALNARNFSATATWAYRAHQAHLQAQVLRAVLET